MEREDPRETSSNLNYILPFELLGIVFSHISEDPLDLRHAIFVCRCWHNVIVHHANLWNSIILGYTFLTRFRGARSHHGVAFVRACLSRSSPLPLRISVHDHRCGSLYGNTLPNADGKLSNESFSLIKHILDINSEEPENFFQRCRSLSWYPYKRLQEVNLVTRALASASLPMLEYLTLKNLLVFNDDLVARFPRLPRLKEVTLTDHSETCIPPLFHDDDLAKAERLSFTVTSRWIDYDVNCVRRFRSIRTLILKGTNIDDDEPYRETRDSPLEQAEFPLLETLTLSGRVAHQVLNLLKTPRLQMMELEASAMEGGYSLMAINSMHMVRSLECLYVSLSGEMHVASWVEELERVVAVAPSLIRLYINPWMAQYLKGKEWRTGLHVTVSS